MSRPLLPWAALAVLGAVSLAWLGLLGFAFTDYELEAAPALAALVDDGFGRFLELCPAYGGSLILRSPFALGADLFGGGEVAVFRAVGMPCLLAGAALGIVLASSLLARRAGKGTIAVVVLLCAANPITLRALDIGHPEELLGAVLCAGAVLAGLRERPVLAGVLLGLALANKAWAVLAIGPVLLALPAGRWRALAVAVGLAGVVTLPLLLAASPTAAAAASTNEIFQPWQVWWFLGSTGEVIRGGDGLVKEGYRAAPGWLSPISHPLIVLVAVPLSLLAWRRRSDPLLLLALLFVLRCVLDPWNTAYYALPAIIALVTWEAWRGERAPLLALVLTAATWATWQWVVPAASPDAEALVYLGWSLPFTALLAWKLYAPAVAMPVLSRGGRANVWSTTQ